RPARDWAPCAASPVSSMSTLSPAQVLSCDSGLHRALLPLSYGWAPSQCLNEERRFAVTVGRFGGPETAGDFWYPTAWATDPMLPGPRDSPARAFWVFRNGQAANLGWPRHMGCY